MVDLKAKSPLAPKKPVVYGQASLRELPMAELTSIAPFANRRDQVSEALQNTLGVSLPDEGATVASGGVEVFWTGQGQYFVRGAQVPALDAAVTDQSDNWTRVALEGPSARDVMARLCPLDLRALQPGDVARSLIGHMSAIILCREEGYELMVFRSMAGTLWHEVCTVMQAVAAREKLQAASAAGL